MKNIPSGRSVLLVASGLASLLAMGSCLTAKTSAEFRLMEPGELGRCVRNACQLHCQGTNFTDRDDFCEKAGTKCGYKTHDVQIGAQDILSGLGILQQVLNAIGTQKLELPKGTVKLPIGCTPSMSQECLFKNGVTKHSDEDGSGLKYRTSSCPRFNKFKCKIGFVEKQYTIAITSWPAWIKALAGIDNITMWITVPTCEANPDAKDGPARLCGQEGPKAVIKTCLDNL